MDDIDRRIVALLQRDARRPYADIGAEVDLAASSVNDRIRKLIAQGVLRGWTVAVDPLALGYDVLAFVHVLLDRPDRAPDFLERVNKLSQIQECHHTTGEWSYLLKVRALSTRDLETFLGTRLQILDGVIRTHTIIALSSPKETTWLEPARP
jgi:Lrp/AsnC family leucine-responsive transcriptional regulator